MKAQGNTYHAVIRATTQTPTIHCSYYFEVTQADATSLYPGFGPESDWTAPISSRGDKDEKTRISWDDPLLAAAQTSPSKVQRWDVVTVGNLSAESLLGGTE
jgi:hypothetical protein